jgi:hypothetical protein
MALHYVSFKRKILVILGRENGKTSKTNRIEFDILLPSSRDTLAGVAQW